MNRTIWTLLLCAATSIFILTGLNNPVASQEDSYEIGYQEIFEKLQRAPVTFPHDLHMTTLDEQGCGLCHHVYDESKRVLVPADGEETTCTECHGADKKAAAPALREAYHGKCTVCHRSLIGKGEKAGPTTCGECHHR